MATINEEKTAYLEAEKGVPPSTDLDGSELAKAKAAFKNSTAVQKANWDREVANKQVRTVVIPSGSRLGQRDPNGVAVQVNGVKFPRLALDTPHEVPESIARIIQDVLDGEKVATQREADFASGKLVIPIGGQ